jgi:hypothetical protein
VVEIIAGGLLGIGGVVVGSLLNSRATLRVEHQRVAREREREARIVRRARRIVADELQTLSGHLFIVGMEARFPADALVQSASFLPLAEWRRNKDVLAELLDDDEWQSLPVLYGNIEAFRYRLHHEAGEEFRERDRRRVMEMSAQAEALASRLAGVKDEPEPGVRSIITDLEGRPVPEDAAA